MLFFIFSHFSDVCIGVYGVECSQTQCGGSCKKKIIIIVWLVVLIHKQSTVTLSVTMFTSVTITMATDNSLAHRLYSIF